jgi:phosphonate transport system substrate-binding protein
MRDFISRFVFAILICGFCGLSLAQSGKPAQDGYSVGIVPQFTSEQITQIWTPVLEELSKRSNVKLYLVPSRTIRFFEIDLESSSFDFAYANPYQSLIAFKKHGYMPVVRDRLPLSGVLVVRKDSPYKKVTDLAGKIIAFPAPNALGASLLIRADLDAVHRISFTPQYSSSHTSAYQSTLNKLSAATGGIEATFGLLSEEDKENLRVLYRTRETISHPFIAHPRVPESVRLNVQNAWLAMSADPAWNQQLAKIPFDRLVKAKVDDYKILDSMNLEKFYIAPNN